MKRLFEDIFIKHYPTLDLHGYDRLSAVVAINDFIEENSKLKNYDLVIIHGIGSGIIRQVTHEILKNNKFVINFKLHSFNVGMTIVKIK